ncbi:MAG: sulfite exporter TauE/SafE family protein [Pseudomonadota bacterium]
MEAIQFIDLTTTTVIILFLVGFVGGMVSGFIGSGGAFVLTPAMMSLGAPAIVAVASNMAHKFPKALVGAIKRAKFGQVDVKLGIVMGLFAEAGVFAGKNIMTGIRDRFGDTGTDLYVSVVFIVVLAIVGSVVLRDALRSMRGESRTKDDLPRLARWVRTARIPGTMMSFRSMDGASVSLMIVAPLGFATGMLAASIAVGGFIGVPAMMYFLGVPAIMATATELVIAFVMGTGGSLLYAWDGFVDIRLAMIILAGSLFGIQIGAIGTTYVREYSVKLVMGMIMLIVLVSRCFKVPVYLSDMGILSTLGTTTRGVLNTLSFTTLALALIVGAVAILSALLKGMAEHRQKHEPFVEAGATD